MTYGVHCEECPLKGKGDIVKAKGSQDARFLVVTDAPNFRPEAYGRLMTQSALTRFGKSMAVESFTKEDFVFHPHVRCPYDPDIFSTKEKSLIAKSCRPYLVEAIDEFEPEVIIPLGVEPSKQVFGRAVKITKVRGMAARSDEFQKSIIMPMLNPVMVVMYPQHESTFAADCATLGRLVDSNYDIEQAGEAVLGEYTIIDDLQFLIDMKQKVIGYDTENTGLSWFAPDAKILTMQFSVEEGVAYLLPWDHPDRPQSARAKKRLIRQLTELLCNDEVTVIGQNAKYDAVYTYAQTGVRYRIGGCTLMLATLIDENSLTKNLDDLVKRYVPAMAGYADGFNATVDKSKMIELPLDSKFVSYGAGDADAVLRVYNVLYPIVAEDDKLLAHYERVTLPGLNAFSSVELRGLCIDEEEVERFEAFMEERVSGMEKALLSQVPKSIKRKHAEKGIKFSRAEFVTDILFDHPDGFKLKPKVFTKTTAKLEKERRKPSTSTKDHLPYFYETCPFTYELSEYVKSARILGTNVKGFKAKYIVDGMVRPTYNLHTAVTGRSSSCVRGDTLVATTYGYKRMDTLTTDDYVFTHKNRFRRVLATYIKPAELMYNIHLSNGQNLLCTAGHGLLTNEGWRTVKDVILESHSNQSGSGSRSVATVPRNRRDSSAGSGAHAAEFQQHSRDTEPQPFQGGAAGAEGQEIQKQQTWVTQSYAGEGSEELHRRLQRRLRILNESSGWGTVLRSSDCYGRNFGNTPVASTGEYGCASFERGYDGQRPGQPCVRYEDGASVDPQSNGLEIRITKIEPASVYTVYDIQVEEDQSYEAAGVKNHNTDPNGQNFPKRGPIAMAYRKLFVAPPRHFLLEADLSQAELRIAGDMANDPTMVKIYREAGDIHTYTALIVLRVSMSEFRELDKKVQKDARTKAKAVNFGFLYGMGWRKFIAYAKTQYGVEFTDKEAQRIRTDFFSRYSKLAEWHGLMRAYAKQYKEVRSYSGRLRHLPMIDSPDEMTSSEAERAAINSPVQGFGSDLGIMACGRIDQEVNPRYLSLVGFVHDAIYAYVPKEYVEWGAKTLKWYMESNPLEEWFGRRMRLPIVADVGFGLNLSEVHEMGAFSTREDPIVGDYEFGKLWEESPESGLFIPTQRRPPNNGRL